MAHESGRRDARPTWITGTGCICAAGGTTGQTMAALYAGQRDPRPPARFQAELDKAHPVFEIASDLDQEIARIGGAEDFAWLRLDCDSTRTSCLALIAAVEACRQARLDPQAMRRMRVGVAVGTTVGCTLNNEEFYRAWRKGSYPDPAPVRRFLANNPALYLSQAMGLRGPVATLANACSSGADAIGLAKSWLEAGLCDLALAGGADELSRVTYLGFSSLMIASREPCRPFDRNRSGLNLGEGAGMLVLETQETAREREIKPLARLAGCGCGLDAYHPTAPHPEGRGLRRAIHQALRQAGIAPRDVGFVNTHGTSTPDNDRVEGAVLADIFGAEIPAAATKAYTGHTLGAAGAIEAVFTVMGLLDQKLPGACGFEEPDPDCRIAPVRTTTAVHARYALSNSLAFGGGNAALVLEKVELP